ncbi:MAG TPA: BatA domain-containing protein, partial [Vicinamibacterales bacterium]|nr:BatA domain-containing protein [Vicinamibacterales bacterium]
MSFLTPLFFLGLGAIAIPILVHLIQREKKHVILFPSLMFVQRIPYQSVRRRRIRHWFLLMMRAAAIVLIAMAFARPFLPQRAAAQVAAIGGNRELVILLDRSASMAYGNHWTRAVDAARSAIGSTGANDRTTLVLFDKNAEEAVRATSDRGRLEAGLGAAKVGAAATRYGPALKLAESILTRSTLARREALLISDFQKSGWSGAEDVHFSDVMRLTPMPIRDDNMANVAVPSVTFSRSSFSGQERITVTAGIANKGAAPVTNLPVTLEVEGQQIATQAVNIAPNASTSITFDPFTLTDPASRGVVKAGTDPLAIDNTFHFVLTPSQQVSVLVIDSGDSSDPSFYLMKALSIGNTPEFHVERTPVSRVSPQLLERRSVVVINDTTVPPGIA